jgi:hypothetical protein
VITDKEMSYEDMTAAIARGSLCMQCNNILVTVWGGAFGYNGWMLACGKDKSHKGITRHDKKYEQKLKEAYSMETTALEKLSQEKMLERVNMARFPQEMKPEEKKLLAQVAITYGFDPLMGEITLYQGRPFVSIDGRYRKAQETGQLDGIETRPANKEEREAWQIPDGDLFFRAELWLTGKTRPIVGWGRVFQAETKGAAFLPIVKNPQRMAEKRAEAQALRKGFHINLPSVEDIGTPEAAEEPPSPYIEGSCCEVDTNTGEIFEEAKAVEPEPPQEPAPKPAPAPTKPPASPAKEAEKPPVPVAQSATPRDPATVKSINELMSACFKDWGMQPQAVLAVLGVGNSSAIVDTPTDCYIKVAAAQPQ